MEIPGRDIVPGSDGMRPPMLGESWLRTDPDIITRLERIERKVDELLSGLRITGLTIKPGNQATTEMPVSWIEETK